MPNNAPHNALRYHVTGAIQRGEKEAITEQPFGDATLETPFGSGVIPMQTTRLQVRIERVAVLGPVRFEPSMMRVRRPDGTVIRTFRDYLTPDERNI